MNESGNENGNDYYNDNINDNDNNYNENNYNKNSNFEKPLHGSQIPNSYNQEDHSNNSIRNFTFLQPNGNNIFFKSAEGDLDYLYQNIRNNTKYAICILVKDDSDSNEKLLKETLEGIKSNILGLSKLMKAENILICAFFNEIKDNSIFDEGDFKSLEDNKYILAQKSYSLDQNDEFISVHCISQKNYFSDIAILKCFYSINIQLLKKDKNYIFSSVITAGVSPISTSLPTLIKISYNNKNSHFIVVPSLEEGGDGSIFYKIKKYEYVHFNLYSMNFYDMTAAVPISSLFNVMTIDNNLYNYLINFYQDVQLNEFIDYHDYNLALYLYNKSCKIIYYNSNNMGRILSSPKIGICDYKNYWVLRYSGYYGNFLGILNTFINFEVCDFIKKIFLFFYIIGLFVEFIFPSLSTMVIYTIFYEAFKIYDERPAIFCTLLYLFILACSGACSLVSINSKTMQITNAFFYYFMEVYYLFILICSIIAMDNVKKNKGFNLENYKFNTAAITCIIIFTFIPAIIPMLLKSKEIISNIVEMLIYLVLGAPASSSSFHIAKILNSPEASGGQNTKERKGIVIILYFLSNLFFGSLVFYNYNRKKRCEAVMGLGIFYLIYNFFKVLAITINILGRNKLTISSDANKDLSLSQSQSLNNMEYSNQQNENDYNNYNVSQSKGPEYPSQSQVENQYGNGSISGNNINNNNSINNNDNDNDNYQNY
jgi:hypothetical protein